MEWPHGRPLLPSTDKNPLGILFDPQTANDFQNYVELLISDLIHQSLEDAVPQAEAEEISGKLADYGDKPIQEIVDRVNGNRSKVIAELKTLRDGILIKHAFFEMDHEFIEMDFLKKAIVNLKAAFDAAVETGGEQPHLNLAFVAESGAGKSEIAPFVAIAFHRFGMIPSNHTVRVSLSEISDTTHGGKEKNLQEKFDAADNGLLLFDEADTVASFMHVGQTRSSISQAINYQAGLRKNRAVVVATYPDNIDIFLNSDKGLRSRFRVVHFPERSTQHYVEVLAKKLENMGLNLEDNDIKRRVWDHFSEIRKMKGKNHVNGRTVEAFANTVSGIILDRAREAGEDMATIINDGYAIPVELRDIQKAIQLEDAPKPEPVDVNAEVNPYVGQIEGPADSNADSDDNVVVRPAQFQGGANPDRGMP